MDIVVIKISFPSLMVFMVWDEWLHITFHKLHNIHIYTGPKVAYNQKMAFPDYIIV